MASRRQALTHSGVRADNAFLLQRNDTCVWCGHTGADAVDHVIPVSRGGSEYAPSNKAPIHGVHGCPYCGVKCNNEKGTKLLAERTDQRNSRDWWTEF